MWQDSAQHSHMTEFESLVQRRGNHTRRRNISQLYKVREDESSVVRMGAEHMADRRLFVAMKAPLQSKMASMLLGVTNRMVRQMQSKRISQLPSLHNDQQATHRMNCLKIFKSIKQIREQKQAKLWQCDYGVKKMNQLTKQRSKCALVSAKDQEIDTKQRPKETMAMDAKGCAKQQNATASSQRQTLSVASSCNLGFASKDQSLFSSTIDQRSGHRKVCKGYLWCIPQTQQFLERQRSKLSEAGEEAQQGVSARQYVVLERSTLRVLAGKDVHASIEIASLSKVMTCFLAILIAQKYEVSLEEYVVRVSDRAVDVPGTSADLQVGDCLSLRNLLFGLMLPSGNDASIAVAEAMGKVLQRHRKPTKKHYLDSFIAEMNAFSKELGFQQTWRNSSGLSQNPNYSSPIAIVALGALAMKNALFRQIVSTKEYEVEIRNERFGLIRKVKWRNTNKLLEDGWGGVKTGITQLAGPCLLAQKNHILIGVFQSRGLLRRFTDCVKLYQTCYDRTLPHISASDFSI